MADQPNVTEEKPSVLGVDPQATVPVAKPAETTPPLAEKPTTKQLSQKEFDELQQKASNYDLIATDPELAPKVVDHFRAKTGRVGKPMTPAPTEEKPAPSVRDDEAFQSLARRQAQLEVTLFKKDHPDMDEYKDDMARLMQRHNMDLDDAYRFSKAAKSQALQKPVTAKPATPTAETNGNAGDLENSDTDLGNVEKRINDPKATPHMDDVYALAFQAAKRKLSNQSEE